MKKEILYSGVEEVKYTFSDNEIKEALINYYNDFVSQSFEWNDAEIILYEDWDGEDWTDNGCAQITIKYRK